MKRFLPLIMILFSVPCLSAGEILSMRTGVFLRPVYFDTIDGALHRMMPVEIVDGETGQRIDFATVDLDQFGFPAEKSSQLEIYVIDWMRDRVLFADTRQVRVPDYHVLDLRTRTVYRPESDILSQVYGDMYMTPNCRYIVYFGEDYDLMNQTGENYLQNHNIMFTVVIDAETFNFVSRLDAFSAWMGSGIPQFSFSSDTAVYIVNPFNGPTDQQLVRFSLPGLVVQDTIKFATVCDTLCGDVAVWDMRSDHALIYTRYAAGDSIQAAYRVIDLLSKRIVSSLDVPLSPIYGAARLSDEADFVAFQERQRYIIYDRLFRRSFELEGAPHYSLPGVLFGNGTIRFYSEIDDAILIYDLETGRERERRDRR